MNDEAFGRRPSPAAATFVYKTTFEFSRAFVQLASLRPGTGVLRLQFAMGGAGLTLDQGVVMKKETPTPHDQPEPFTPGMSKADVRQHAFQLYRDKLKENHALTLEDWVLAEKDLVETMNSEDSIPSQSEGR
jgi:hypothetical protein